MIAYYGFKDGSGDWFVIIDTDKCTGCSKCVEVCPANVLEVGEDEYDPFSEELVASVRAEAQQGSDGFRPRNRAYRCVGN